jgi:hypothetical protein
LATTRYEKALRAKGGLFDEGTDSPLFFEFVQFFFPIDDPQELGPLATSFNPQSVVSPSFSDACTNVPGGTDGNPACYPDYAVTGSTALAGAPEPSSFVLLLFGGLVMIGALHRTKRSLEHS